MRRARIYAYTVDHTRTVFGPMPWHEAEHRAQALVEAIGSPYGMVIVKEAR